MDSSYLVCSISVQALTCVKIVREDVAVPTPHDAKVFKYLATKDSVCSLYGLNGLKAVHDVESLHRLICGTGDYES